MSRCSVIAFSHKFYKGQIYLFLVLWLRKLREVILGCPSTSAHLTEAETPPTFLPTPSPPWIPASRTNCLLDILLCIQD